MADNPILIEVSGASGPVGPASGALGAGSVEAVHITNDAAKIDLIASKLGFDGAGTFGSTAAQGIDTYLAGSAVPADIGPVYMGVVAQSADGITIDSAANFPPGIAFRKCLGTLEAPAVVTPGTQLGYNDYRGYNIDGVGGAFFYNAGSLDVLVAGGIDILPGKTPPTFMRFAGCKDINIGAEEGMRLTPSGTGQFGLYINSVHGEFTDFPSDGVAPALHVASRNPDWVSNIEAKNGEMNFGQRIKLSTANDSDFFMYGISNGVPRYAFRGDGRVTIGHAAFPVCTLDVDGPVRVKSYTKTTLPIGNTSGQIIFVSDDAGGATIAYSDAGAWRRVADRAVIA